MIEFAFVMVNEVIELMVDEIIELMVHEEEEEQMTF
jgi:hypothetical protein